MAMDVKRMKEGKVRGQRTYALGLDFSTQAVKIVVLDVHSAEVLYTGSFDYDNAFGYYGTRGGVLPAEQLEIRHTSPFMLIEALDLAFRRLHEGHVDMSCIKAVKSDAMQHCTVYTGASFGERVAVLDHHQYLLPQLGSSITRQTSPIWEDRSPVKEAAYIASALEKYGSIEAITGNRAELRFPAAQILKWASQSPHEYCQTAHIFLLSAFLSSILAGKIVPIDTGDGWGTNLNALDIQHPGWSNVILKVANDYLDSRKTGLLVRDKLGEMAHFDTPVGKISPYFVKKYGINPDAMVLVGTGDNPATLLGCGGRAVISLGSSYTINGIMHKITPSLTGEYNIFGYIPGKAMALTVFTNGAKVHEFFLEKYISRGKGVSGVEKNWDAYVSAAGEAIMLEDEKLMLPYLIDESVPLRPRGIVREGFDELDAEVNIRALHISQALSLRLHSGHLSYAGALCLVGGGTKNRFLRQVITDIFNTGTFAIRYADLAAPFGCAVSGARYLLDISYEDAASKFVEVDRGSFMYPLRQNQSSIRTLLQRYEALQKSKNTQ
jgi:xylulokinase